jgi:hypothetical protein
MNTLTLNAVRISSALDLRKLTVDVSRNNRGRFQDIEIHDATQDMASNMTKKGEAQGAGNSTGDGGEEQVEVQQTDRLLHPINDGSGQTPLACKQELMINYPTKMTFWVRVWGLWPEQGGQEDQATRRDDEGGEVELEDMEDAGDGKKQKGPADKIQADYDGSSQIDSRTG